MNKQSATPIVVKILLILFIQTLFLVAMVANKQLILSSDTIVILPTKPIDPRSLFRGDYVRLNYKINELQLDKLSGDKVFKRNDTIYVVLQSLGNFWYSQAVYLSKNKLSKDFSEAMQSDQYALIQGVVKRVNNRYSDKSGSNVSTLQVSYGIENYFLPEGEGLKLERPAAGDKITLKIALDDDGHAVIKALLLNGVQQYEETLF